MTPTRLAAILAMLLAAIWIAIYALVLPARAEENDRHVQGITFRAYGVGSAKMVPIFCGQLLKLIDDEYHRQVKAERARMGPMSVAAQALDMAGEIRTACKK